MPPSVTCLLQQDHTFQAYSHSTSNWGPSSQTPELIRDILTQTTLYPWALRHRFSATMLYSASLWRPGLLPDSNVNADHLLTILLLLLPESDYVYRVCTRLEQTLCTVFDTDSWNMLTWQPTAFLSLCCFTLTFTRFQEWQPCICASAQCRVTGTMATGIVPYHITQTLSDFDWSLQHLCVTVISRAEELYRSFINYQRKLSLLDYVKYCMTTVIFQLPTEVSCTALSLVDALPGPFFLG